VLVLAHDPESLSYRTPLFNAIMYGDNGLSRAERELGAVGASVVNHCVYCAAVHANRFIALAKQPEVIDAIFRDGEAVKLAARQQAIFDFAAKLSHAPSRADAQDIAALKSVGMNELEIFDLILSIGIFGWANRLMHTLGEPVA
jgi:uncharacterized peroxidase-related enzyme